MSQISTRQDPATAVKRWNDNYAIGTRVTYRDDFGKFLSTRTCTPAAVLGGHTAVIWLAGKSGCVALDRIMPSGIGGCAQ